nr:VOC family protein [Aeromicrobium senzhongii]
MRQGPTPIGGAVLDHVAVGVGDLALPRPFLESIGASPLSIGDAPGFRAQQWLFRSGIRLEILAPARVAENDFLERFIQRGGPGPHHLTFLVDDLSEAVATSESAGFPILYANFDNPLWQEAFIHPRHACGTVVQLAQAPDWKVPDVDPPSADLPVINFDVCDESRALALYGDLLGGVVSVEEQGVLLSWPGTASIALHRTEREDLPGRIRSFAVRGPHVTAAPTTLMGVEFEVLT